MIKDYSQPDFYRFNSDSIELIRWVTKHCPKAHKILDLGAGCGIIGIELARHLSPEKLVLVELQSQFEAHLMENCDQFLPSSTDADILIRSFSALDLQDKFDLIVSNPPYYLPGKGEVAQNPQRALARTFLQDTWDELIKKIASLMSSGGKAYVVLKGDQILLKEIEHTAKSWGLELIQHPHNSLTILELFALDKK